MFLSNVFNHPGLKTRFCWVWNEEWIFPCFQFKLNPHTQCCETQDST